MSAPTTRRRFITGAAAYATGAAAVTGVAALATEAKGASAPVSPTLLSLIEATRHGEAVWERHERLVYVPAANRRLAAIARINHVTVEPAAHWVGPQDYWSTYNEDAIRVARRLIKQEGRSQRSDVKCARKLIAANHRRERAMKRASIDSGHAQACRDSDELGKVNCRQEDAVVDFRPRTATDLNAKVLYLIERSYEVDSPYLLEMVRDDLASIIEAGQV